MRAAMITTVLLLHELACAGTSMAPEKPLEKAIGNAAQLGAVTTQVKFQPQQEAARLSAAPDATPPLQAAKNSSAALNDVREAEGLSWGTLLAALALMIAIAVRRTSAEKT